jgi:hypothetical protein
LFVVATGPDITSISWWKGTTVSSSEWFWMSDAFSGPRRVQRSDFDADFPAPPGRLTSHRDVRTIGAGTVSLAFAVIWLLLRLASPRKRYSKSRGFEVLPVSV